MHYMAAIQGLLSIVYKHVGHVRNIYIIFLDFLSNPEGRDVYAFCPHNNPVSFMLSGDLDQSLADLNTVV